MMVLAAFRFAQLRWALALPRQVPKLDGEASLLQAESIWFLKTPEVEPSWWDWWGFSGEIKN